MSMMNVGGDKSGSILTNVSPGDIQPNAVDLKIDKVFKINDVTFTINEAEKCHRGSEELLPNDSGWWHLPIGSYEVIMENQIQVDHGEAGFVITRSSLNRNGVFLTSGLYDSGYHGVMAGVMHVGVGPMKIQRGTRIGQYLCWIAEALHNYDGDYGVGKSHDDKYVTV